MSALTPNFKPFGLQTRLEIYDYDGILKYTYESEDVKAIKAIAALDLNSRVIDLVGEQNGKWTGTARYVTGKKQENAADFQGAEYITLDAGESEPAEISLANLKAHWKFNDSLGDSAKINSDIDGVITGTETYIAGKWKKAIDLNGSSYVKFNSESVFDFERTDSFSVSFWIKTSSVSKTLVSKLNGSSPNEGWSIEINASGAILVFLINNFGGGNYINVDAVPTMNDNTWHYISVTYDGSSTAAGVKIYQDGVLATDIDGTDNLSASILNNLQCTVGARPTGTQIITGQMDDVRIYKSELTATNVADLYKGKFDFERTDKFSISFWVKRDVTGTLSLVVKTNDISNAGTGYSVIFDGSNQILFRLANGGIDDRLLVGSALDTEWHHVIVTYAGNSNLNGMKIYYDGVLNNTGTSASITGSIINSVNLVLGAKSDGGLKFDGKLEQVKIYNIELTQAQVTELSASSSPYGFVTKTTAATQDFRLTDLLLNINGNGNMGNATLMIEDNSDVLTDSTDIRRRSKIKRMWDVQIFLGKDAPSMERWFYGKTLETAILRPGTNQQHLAVGCIGWGTILKDRITKITRNQDKASNGIDLDDTDTKTRLDNLINDMFTKKDHQMDENLPLITSMSAIFAETGICQACLDIKIANVNELGNTYAGFIAKLVSLANSDWYIDRDRQLVVRDADTHESGFLFTNDLTALDAQNWDSEKIAYLKNNIVSWRDTAFDTMYSFLHGFGHFAPVIDVKEETTPDASENLDDEWVAIPFTPTQDNIFKIAFRMIKTGTPPEQLTIEIRGDDGSGDPDVNDIRRTLKITKEHLGTLGTSTPATWGEFPVKPRMEVTPNEILYIVFKKYGDVSNTVNVNLKAGSGTYRVSADGISWTSPVGKMNYRIYSAKRLTTTLEDAGLSKKLSEPREKLIPIRADLEEQTVRQAMLAASDLLGKERRVYDKVVINACSKPPPLASYAKLQDKKTGLNVNARIIQYALELHGNDITRVGANEITLTLDDVHTV